MWRKRARGWLYITMAVFLLLGIRLMQIQLFAAESFSKHHINLLEESVKQRSQEFVLDNGRGNFLDRNGSILNSKKAFVLVLFPFLKKTNWDSGKVAQVSGLSSELLKDAVKNANKPFIYGKSAPIELTESQMNQINALNIPGVFAIERKQERSDLLAQQLIGVTGENQRELQKRYPKKALSKQTLIGVSGLEQSFDEFLLPEGKAKLVYHVDGNGAPLFGLNVRYVAPANPYYPVNLRTTLDKEIQTKAEALLDTHHIQKGGIVLLDIKTNSILALASRPKVNKKNPYKGLGVSNLMVKQQIMGSVFKTVVAAAAIDANLDGPERRFDCNKKINGEPDLIYRYGKLNFTDSFARSCNNAFGQLAQELTKSNPEVLEDYAAKLSLSGPVGWQGDVFHENDFKQLGDEEKGRVFTSHNEKLDANYVAMTGIGQREVRSTPLAAANMMAEIARGGQAKMVRAVSKIEYKNGATMIEFKEENLPHASISPYTAMKLQKLLRAVVLHPQGTGKWLQYLPYDVAGKSGTAETGKYQNGKQLHNKWFAGYFPYHHPKYALVAVNLDVYDQEGGVNSLYADMVKMLYDFDHRQ
ncbi:peptidoglycan D,D-transpeptidase FtsI family protein [Bacillota bacterium Lsc_1132]